MIIGITGGLCSGKKTLVNFLLESYKFEGVNIEEIFKHRLREILQKERKEKEDALKD